MKNNQFLNDLFTLRASTPGRERWDVQGLIGQSTLAKEIQNVLEAQKDVYLVKANTVTGRILIQFDFNTYQNGARSLIRQALEKVMLEAFATPDAQSDKDRPLKDVSDLTLLHDLINSFGSGSDSQLKMAGRSVGSTLASLMAPVTLAGIMSVAISGPIGLLKGLGLKTAMTQLGALGLAFLVLEWVELLLEQKAKKRWHNYGTEVEDDLRTKAFENLEHLDMAYLESHSTGQLRNIVHEDTIQIRKFLESIPHSSVEKGVTFGLGGVFLLALSPFSFLLSLTPLPVCYLLFQRHRKQLGQSYQAQSEKESQLGHQINNSLSGLATIKSYTTESFELERLIHSSATHKELLRSANTKSSKYANAIRYSITAGISLPMLYTGAMVVGGTLAAPAYIMLIFLLPRLVTSMSGLDNDYDLYLSTVAAARRLQKVLDAVPQVDSGSQYLPAEHIRGSLSFDKVSFGYDDDQHIFKNFSLQIPHNSSTAFVGTTGSGKSTLIKLLLRFYDTSEGRILFDSHDIRDLKLQDLRQSISFVSQDVFLFQGSIYDNILYGRADASFDEVVAAANAAQILEFINESPEGFNTQIGERGLNLSGGQRQRISIARAVLKDAPVLILDEATSSVDNETEAAIQQAINGLLQHRTLIIIAHRLSTVRHVDCIHVLNNGQICESGTHETLLASNGRYATLWRLQTGQLESDSASMQQDEAHLSPQLILDK